MDKSERAGVHNLLMNTSWIKKHFFEMALQYPRTEINFSLPPRPRVKRPHAASRVVVLQGFGRDAEVCGAGVRDQNR